jgi:CRP-like cAMP-binding protein
MYTDVPTRSRDGATLTPVDRHGAPAAALDVTRHASRLPKTRRRRNSVFGALEGAGEDRSRPIALKNQILLQLAAHDREALLAGSTYVSLPVGHNWIRPGERTSSMYFPDTGVISSVSEMTTGHQVAVAATGAEGVIGLGLLFSIQLQPVSQVVLLESRGNQISAERFLTVFQQSEYLRRVILAHVGRRMRELATAAACNRVHSHRQRLARWLLVITDKANQQSLPLTHETLAQMVGGPRHAVTVALKELRAKGAIALLRGRIDIRKRSVLVAQACECYVAPPAVYRAVPT